MSEIVDIDEIRHAISRMSVEFYHASSDLGWIDENTELIRGLPLNKMSKSPLHEYFVSLFLRMIEKVIQPGQFVIKERPLTTHDSEPEPDLMVVSGREEDFKWSHPKTADLVIEVAINTEKRDLEKALIYAEVGVGEYWLVFPEKSMIVVFREGNGREYQDIAHLSSGMLTSTTLSGLSVDISAIF